MPAKKTKKKTIKKTATRKKTAKTRSAAPVAKKRSAKKRAPTARVVPINCGCVGSPSRSAANPDPSNLNPGDIARMHATNTDIEITFRNGSPFVSLRTQFTIQRNTFHDETVRPDLPTSPKNHFRYGVRSTSGDCPQFVEDAEMIVP